MEGMSAIYEHRILALIDAYDAWARELFRDPESWSIGAEWESDYLGWSEIYDSFTRMLKESLPEEYGADFLQKLLYLIGRDNEDEHLIETLANYPNWFEVLCPLALNFHGEGYMFDASQTRWQFATYLELCDCAQATKELLTGFMEDEDAFVRLRAFGALPNACPTYVKKYADKWWYSPQKTEKEQVGKRIAVLRVLYEASSPLLAHYVELAQALDDKRYYQALKQIEQGHTFNGRPVLYYGVDVVDEPREMAK